MSELRVDNIVDMGGSGAPQLRKGASVTGISTITQAVVGNATINAGGINATGIVTSSSNKFVGDLASGNITAGVMTATSSVVASNITINSGGVNASGIVSATSYQGSGANLTGIGLSIAPLAYNPDVSDGQVPFGTGIGLTFNQRVSAGTGNVTLSLVAVGSTLVENFSVGSSVTYNNDADPPNITINPTADLAKDTVYAISYPSGAFTQSGAGGSFVGTAYTFSTQEINNELWSWGRNTLGYLGHNNRTDYSSPVQIPGTDWTNVNQGNAHDSNTNHALKSDGSLWMWGTNTNGTLGQNDTNRRSSPVQVPGTWNAVTSGSYHIFGVKTDGTLWAWGQNGQGALGNNEDADNDSGAYSSPIQIGSDTTWGTEIGGGMQYSVAIKTNGTLWNWGRGGSGSLGIPSFGEASRSSPVQIPGTTWSKLSRGNFYGGGAIKTDGTLWMWGTNDNGELGINAQGSQRSSPTQVPGTNWATVNRTNKATIATKTNGTLWSWGYNSKGILGQNNNVYYSSPVQIGSSTDWSTGSEDIVIGSQLAGAIKTDGTLWLWGTNTKGGLGQNNTTTVSSPVQVPGTTWSQLSLRTLDVVTALKEL